MRKISIEELLEDKGASYEEDYPTPIDQHLQRAVRIGGISTAVAIPVSLLCVPMLSSWAYAGFFWFLGDISVGLLALLRSPVGICLNVIALAIFGLLWLQTSGLQPAPLLWHRVGLGVSAVGAVDLAIVGLPVLIVAVNILIWAVAIAAVIGIAVLFLAGLAASSR